MEHPTLHRILKQIEEHKGELTKPENSMGRLVKESTGPYKLGEPVLDVSEVFTESLLDQREKELKLIDQENEKRQEALDSEGQKMADVLEKGGSYADIVPQEPEEAEGVSLPEEVQEYLDSEKDEYSFHSCYDLRDFIKNNREKFDDWAQPAVNSVLAAVDSITSGCKCKVEQRKRMVEDYYVKFISQNQHTSLIDKMKEILKTKKVKFYSNDELFLEK